ncbi:glycine zipper family protein [Oceanicella sp. SM1341]|uniref:glycine zipper family protein n=1 Tax=Oceanicella sp. SM1341 TaxID=1548889 RepID=UPI000E4D31CA|nr:glycine zipper family protein [Oceanicella sp. SM1341]
MTRILALCAALALTACSDLNDTQQRAATGTIIGAGSGAVIGAIAGDAGMGALIGAGAGAVGGLVYDKVEHDKDEAYRQGVRDGRATR